jgi:thiamine biosynthesis lipoprotein
MRRGVSMAVAFAAAALLAGCARPIGWPAAASPAPAPAELSVSRLAMGTLVTIVVRDPDSTRGRTSIEEAFAEIERLESLISEWRESSEISAVNRSAGDGWTQVSPETLAVLEASRALAAESNGTFDPTVLPLVRLWGFEGGEQRVPDANAIASTRERVGWEAIELDARDGRARLSRPGAAIGLGAIGKGFIADRALQKIRAAGVPAAMVKASGDLAFYGGTPARPWPIAIEDPSRPGEAMAELEVLTGGVSTSAPTWRYFETDGAVYHHLIDPRTGRPARGVRSVTLVAPDATRSDGLDTAVFVMGEAGPAFVEARPELGAVILFEDGRRFASPALGVRWTDGR